MIAYNLATYLSDQGFGVINDDLFVTSMPDSPNSATCLYDEPGITLPQNHYDNSDSFGLMIKFRGYYPEVKDRALNLHREIAGLGDLWLDELYLLDTRIQTPLGDTGVDKSGRTELTVHYIHYVKIFNNKHRKTITQS